MVRVEYLTGLFFAVLLLNACTQELSDPRIDEFLVIYPHAEQSTQHFSGSDKDLVEDFLRTECPEIELPFNRIQYKQYGAKLILYEQNGDIICALSKIEPATPQIEKGDATTVPENVALKINDEYIYLSELQAIYSTLPAEQQTLNSVDQIINQLVTQKLLYKEAQEYDVNVNTKYRHFLQENNLTEEEFIKQLPPETTLQQIKEQLETQLKIEQLLHEKLQLDDISVSQETARNYYLQNTETFLVTEQATIQQIFLSKTERTTTQLEQLQQEISSQITEKSFCLLVTQYSEDVTSKNDCGIYTVSKGTINPVIEQAIFGEQEGAIVRVETEQGIHIIKILQYGGTRIIPYADIQNQVQGQLQDEIVRLRLQAYLASLTKDVTIINYLEVRQ